MKIKLEKIVKFDCFCLFKQLLVNEVVKLM